MEQEMNNIHAKYIISVHENQERHDSFFKTEVYMTALKKSVPIELEKILSWQVDSENGQIVLLGLSGGRIFIAYTSNETSGWSIVGHSRMPFKELSLFDKLRGFIRRFMDEAYK